MHGGHDHLPLIGVVRLGVFGHLSQWRTSYAGLTDKWRWGGTVAMAMVFNRLQPYRGFNGC